MIKLFISRSIIFLLTSTLLTPFVLKAQNRRANQIVLSNSKISWAFDKNKGKLLSFKDLSSNQDFLSSKIKDASIWELRFTASTENRRSWLPTLDAFLTLQVSSERYAVRPPQMTLPEEEISISKLSIYAGQDKKVTTYKKSYPMVYAGAWNAADGALAITLANILDQPYTCKFNILAADYGLKNRGNVYRLTENARTRIGTYKNGKITIAEQLPAMGLSIIEIIPAK